MTAAEFETQFSRLAAHFHLPADASRDTLAVDWLKALQHYHVDALEHAVTELTKTSTDRFWPALGRVMELIKSRIGRYDRTPGACATCHGSTWIEAQPWKANGQIYTGVQRCPDCGIPAPQSDERRNSQPLTSVEFHEYQAGRYMRTQMPPGLDAKPTREGEKTEMREAMARLHAKLFGMRNAKGDLA
jgi:hypothetical protein